MSWFSYYKERICRHLIHKFLGNFIKDRLKVDQLNLQVINGTLNVSNVSVNCDALNELAEQHNLPVEFVEGQLENIFVEIPWTELASKSSRVVITGLRITIRPKKRVDNGNSMLDSMYTSMASSMQLKEDYLKTSEENDEDPYDSANNDQERVSGLDQCAQTIEEIMSRCEVAINDTIVRVEKYQTGSDIGVALEFQIKSLSYCNEGCQEFRDKNNETFPRAFSLRKINLQGITCVTDVFTSKLYNDRMNMADSMTNEEFSVKNDEDNRVKLGEFGGNNEIKIKVKVDESIGGPQISADCVFGSLVAFMSPIQAHILYILFDEILNPAASSSDDVDSGNTCREKPMDSFDFKRLHNELQEHLNPVEIGISNLTQQRWSSPTFNDDSDDDFLPFSSSKSKSSMYHSSVSNFMNASATSIASSMQQSVTDSLASSTVKSSPYKYSLPKVATSNHQSPEKTRFKLQFGSISVILLHEDILTLSATEGVVPSSLEEMKDCSKTFFRAMKLFGVTADGLSDTNRETINAASSRSHHRLIAAPLNIEGLVVQSTASTTETTGQMTLGFCEVTESLKDKRPMAGTPNPEFIEVLTFPKKNFDHGNSQSLKMEFKSSSHKGRTSMASKTSLKFSLQECHCELDLSILDRINSLLNPVLPCYLESKLDPMRSQYNVYQRRKPRSILKIGVKCTCFWLNFRFPIPDLRPLNDSNRIPYWVRNLQNDSIVMQLNELHISTDIDSSVETLEFDIKCHEARLYYKKTPMEKPILFATALADDPEVDGTSMCTKGLDWPRLVVWMYPERSSDLPGEADSSDEGESMDAFMSGSKKAPSPFSAKRVVHETLRAQEDDQDLNSGESVIPGDRSEMNDFIEATTKNVRYKVELNLRFVDVSFPSKYLFEEIYNRVGNDLLLWEPSHMKPTNFPNQSQTSVKPQLSTFTLCKSAVRLDPESDSDEEMSAFYTPSSGLTGESENNNKSKSKSLGFDQSEFAFSLNIGKGIGSFYTPLQDLSGNTVPGQRGQLTIKLEQGTLFVVSSYKGDTNLGYVCLTSRKAEMYHSDFIRNHDIFPRISSELMKTIYPSNDGILTKPTLESSMTDSCDMLSLAIKIDRDSQKNVKTFKVAASIREGTLDHRKYLPNRSWFTQLTDFFDVNDTPVIGYTPATVLTELHLHLWNCAVDYKPLNIPLRSILTMEAFSVSSNVAAQTSTSVIRFMAEDAAFYLTTKTGSTNIRNDYVCVMDMDFFELSLRLCTNRNSAAPRIDLTAISNVLHIRTCSDSFKALMELITYYNSDGDLADPNQQVENENESIPCTPIKESNSEPALITTEEIVERERRMSVSQTEHVHDMVAEAMEDAPLNNAPKLSQNMGSGQVYEIHFTSNSEGEYSRQEESTCSTPLPDDPIMETSNGYPVDIQLSDEDEEEFCLLENDPGVGIVPKHGEPEARVLCREPIRLIENYFAPPVGKMDILKAPKHYPNPVMKYALKEMSIIWHMYGGTDFSPSSSRKSSVKTDEKGSSETLYSYSDSWKEQTEYYDQSDQNEASSIDILNPLGVTFSRSNGFESAWGSYGSPQNQRKQQSEGHISWRHQGGKGRKHDVVVELHLSKIKLVHELYPENTEQASRQVLVINNVEILDKLASSQFNKMMYLYTTSAKPKQTHANMVMIKAAHIRPDPQLSMEECCLKISLLPIRLNIDQDALLFVIQFFADICGKADSEDDDSYTGRLTSTLSHTPSVESLPIMTVNVSEEGGEGSDGEDVSNLLLFNDDTYGMEDTASTCSRDPSIDSNKPSSPVYFRQIIFSPEVQIMVNYKGKRVDMTHGPLRGLALGLANFNNLEIRLKKIVHRAGVLGVDRMLQQLLSEWVEDIRKNQKQGVIAGVGPMSTFVQLVQGMVDLFWLPIEQYQKDGRIAKGLQRGVNAFSTSTAMAALELTNKFIQTVQGVAEVIFDIVSPEPSLSRKRQQSSKRTKRNQPGDIREGMTNAYNVVREGLGDTAHTIVRVASKEHEQKGLSGAVGGVLRQIPPTVVRPVILVAEATSNVLDGFRCQLEPEFKKENEEKWKE